MACTVVKSLGVLGTIFVNINSNRVPLNLVRTYIWTLKVILLFKN